MNKRPFAILAFTMLFGTGIVLMNALGKAGVSVVNHSGKPAVVYVAFGSDSVVKSFEFCKITGRLACKFPLADRESQELPTAGKYLNATISVNGPVTCGKTKAELNINNPKWFDIVDLSLVDGFDVPMSMLVSDTSGKHTIDVKKKTGNEKAFGVYPDGCDICTARQNPPCGMSPGSDGCKMGSQYQPDVPCQYQGSKMGGGSNITLTLL